MRGLSEQEMGHVYGGGGKYTPPCKNSHKHKSSHKHNSCHKHKSSHKDKKHKKC